ncbi:MAG TPA: metalloregulator ArsR/SmtB family transcription factor [Vicinamibacterales bacterium]|nr:metalloregulator ArsR/SmtB family transcription factor [Vicinamibacterales bacterium]
MIKLTDELFEQIAERFKALAEPARLRILDALRHGERTVGELGEKTGLNQANLSKHLQLLHALSFVARRKDGLFVRYSLRSDDVFALCDIMCGRLTNGAAANGSRRPSSAALSVSVSRMPARVRSGRR